MDTNYYYFNGSTVAISDPNAVWTNEANLIDNDPTGSTTADYAGGTTDGSTSLNFMYAGGTDAPASGVPISNVSFRAWGGQFCDASMTAVIYTAGLAEALIAYGVDIGSPPLGWRKWQPLNTPIGGWTYAKLQALEIKVYCTGLVGTTGTPRIGGASIIVNKGFTTGGFYMRQGWQ